MICRFPTKSSNTVLVTVQDGPGESSSPQSRPSDRDDESDNYIINDASHTEGQNGRPAPRPRRHARLVWGMSICCWLTFFHRSHFSQLQPSSTTPSGST